MQRRGRSGPLHGWTARAAVVAAALMASTHALPAQTAPAKPPRPASHSYHDFRLGIFSLSKLDTASIVMVGDSLTEAGPWDELTGCRSIANRGIGGDTTTGVLARLDDVIRLRPHAAFVMIGVNDISLGIPRETSVANFKSILDRLAAAKIRVFAAYVLPVTKSYAHAGRNDAIIALNQAYATVLAARPDVAAVDLRPLVRGADGYLREDLSLDGLHLGAAGYAIWRDAIAAPVAQFCTSP